MRPGTLRKVKNMTKNQTPLFPQPSKPTKLQKVERILERLMLGKHYHRTTH